jgi:hypothetical protein
VVAAAKRVMSFKGSQFHGPGWQALLEQASYLERFPNDRHVLVSFDLLTGERKECVVTGAKEVAEMVGLLRQKAEEWRKTQRASPWN